MFSDKKLFRYVTNKLGPFLILATNLLNFQNPRFLYKYKNFICRVCGINIGKEVLLSSGFKCLYPSNITLQDNVSIGHDNSIWAFNRVVIGKYTHTAKDLLIISGSHENDSFSPKECNQEVIIGQGCWIGVRVTILGGVKIGKGCIIGACSLVNKDIPDWSIAVGVPAKVIKKREPAVEITSPLKNYSPEDLEDLFLV